MLLAFLFAVAINIGYYLSYRDIALISNSASDNALDDKQAYDTLIRPGFAFKQIGDAVVAVCWLLAAKVFPIAISLTLINACASMHL